MSDDEKLVDDDAEEEQAEGSPGGRKDASSVDSSDEEDDDQNEYEEDGFVVNEDADEEDGGEEDSDDEARAKKKKKKRKKNFQLDEEDYDLLADNQVQVKRPTGHKRLKRVEGGRAQKYSEREHFEEDLFGGRADLEDEIADLEGDEREAVAREDRMAEEEEDEDLDGDELDDFIVEGDGEDGKPRRRKKGGTMAGVSAERLEIAKELFGDVDDVVAAYMKNRNDHIAAAGLDVDEGDEEEEEDVSDEEEAERRRVAKDQRLRQRKLERVRKVLDPEMVAEHHLLPEDTIIREMDIPERLQLAAGRLLSAEMDLTKATEWVYESLFGESAPQHHARRLVEEGILEVDGNPPDADAWLTRDLLIENKAIVDEETNLRNRRGVRRPRKENRWLESEETQQRLREMIRNVLRLFWEKHEEVPLVAMYRKEQCGDLLALRDADVPAVTTTATRKLYPIASVQPSHRRIRRWEVLWHVFDLSLRYKRFANRRDLRISAYTAALDFVEAEEDRDAIKNCISELENATSLETLDDMDAHFKLISDAYRLDEHMADLLTGPRRPLRGSSYRHFRQASLNDLLKRFVISPTQLASRLGDGYGSSLDVMLVAPDKWAEQMVEECGLEGYGFSNGEVLMSSLKRMAHMELVAEPQVRQWLRKRFMRHACVTTTPTEAGEAEIDPMHKFGMVKRLKNKPLHTFGDTDLFLRIVTAERHRLLTVTLEVPENDFAEFILKDLEDAYLSGDYSEVAKKWDEARKDIIKNMLANLLPVIQQEMRTKLLAEARAVSLRKASEKLWEFAAAPPLRMKAYDEMSQAEEVIHEDFNTISICWGQGGHSGHHTVAVMVSAHGALVDLLYLGQLSGNIPRSGIRDSELLKDERKAADLSKLLDKIKDFAPPFVVVGASSPQCMQLHADLDVLAKGLLDSDPQFLQSLETKSVQPCLVDERIAALWENSAAALREFPEQPACVRRAVALARCQLDPLSVVASLCGPKMEVLSLSLCDMQAELPRDMLHGMVEQTIVTAACQVGVDINRAAALTWRAAPLPFVAGLGRRKAAALLKAVARNGGMVETRQQMWKKLGVLGKVVFRNCGAFVRVSGAGLPHLANTSFLNLDNTRITPENWRLAMKIAQAAVGAEDIDAAMDAPDKVEQVDFEKLARDEQIPTRLTSLIDIAFELVRPADELRVAQELNPEVEAEKKFLWCHNETVDSLRVNRLVEAQIRYVGMHSARLTLLPSGVEALLEKGYVSGQFTVDGTGKMDKVPLTEMLKKDQVVKARIRGGGLVSKKSPEGDGFRFYVELSTRSKDVLDSDRYIEKQVCGNDDYYVIPTKEDRERNISVLRNAPREKTFIARPIKHPAFENISAADLGRRLMESSEPLGAFRLRPAGRGPGFLGLTVKVADDLVQHVDISETRKPGNNSLALTCPLVVRLPGELAEYKCEDLDEVVANYVEPLVERLKALSLHRKFQKGDDAAVQQCLLAQRPPNGAPGVAYCMALDHGKPGYFRIVFAKFSPRTMEPEVHKEYFCVVHTGFFFRKRLYPTVDKMLDEFKRNPAGDRPTQAQVNQQQGYSFPANTYYGQPAMVGQQPRSGYQYM